MADLTEVVTHVDPCISLGMAERLDGRIVDAALDDPSTDQELRAEHGRLAGDARTGVAWRRWSVTTRLDPRRDNRSMERREHHHRAPSRAGPLATALAVVLVLTAGEIVTGIFSHSLALLGDAGHLITDAASLALALFAVRRTVQPASSRHTFGHLRGGILVAAVNGAALLVVAAGLAVAAVLRLAHPAAVAPVPVIVAAAVAVAVNAGLAGLLSRAGTELSVRSALVHIVADAAAAAGVLLSGLLILTTGWQAADPLLSLLIAGLITAGALRLLNEARLILGEGTPADVDPQGVRSTILDVRGVDGVHDLHIWSIDRNHRALSAHISVSDRPLAEVTALVRKVETRLCAEFGIEHATIQPECPDCAPETGLFCDLDQRHALIHDTAER